tara:strand:+ start:15553 stop:16704 length:1152 start_codon:yes stop_codon:yes gene_type:complete
MAEQADALGLSDEEFINQDPAPYLTDESVELVDTLDQEYEESEVNPFEDETSEEDSEAQEQSGADDDDEEVGEPDGDTLTELENSDEADSEESLDTSKKDSPDTNEDTQDTTEFDYESAYKKVTEPFKANGIEMKVTDPKDIIQLMQMGANYQKKMATMKPNLKIVKMLENAGLLDESKLNNLIDISKKDPKAVAKLIEESGIDPLDIDTDNKTDYQPTDYSVSDKEFNLDTVLESIKDSPTFSKTIDVLTKQWDEGSKATVSDNPEIISVINDHMSTGVYDKVNAAMQQQKALGKLDGFTDVESYKQIAEYMHKEGMLGEVVDDQPSSSEVSSETNAAAKADRTKRRKAVAPVKQTTSVKPPESGEFLGLSDDEFMKKHASQ